MRRNNSRRKAEGRQWADGVEKLNFRSEFGIVTKSNPHNRATFNEHLPGKGKATRENFRFRVFQQNRHDALGDEWPLEKAEFRDRFALCTFHSRANSLVGFTERFATRARSLGRGLAVQKG